jgi:PPK2 family polyphosphate:nucleotide phosphotransferase
MMLHVDLDIVQQYRVKPDTRVDLSIWDPNEKRAFPHKKKQGKRLLKHLNNRLEALQELFYAEGKHKLLVVLQGMDTSGKGGVIRHVFEGVNPQGVKVANFKVPTRQELAHDYLWRVHKQTPGTGEIVIFDRSHYEDVLVVRVHELVPPDTWSRRYHHINQFERLLADEGTTILKFYLHIDLDEQKERLQDRLDEPDKHWKFNPGDLEERRLWPQYTTAYEDVLSKTSTDWAPWHIIPANRKWYRNLVISTVIIQTLESLDMHFPEPDFDPADIQIT